MNCEEGERERETINEIMWDSVKFGLFFFIWVWLSDILIYIERKRNYVRLFQAVWISSPSLLSPLFNLVLMQVVMNWNLLFFFFREELQTALSAAQQQNNKQTMLCIAPLIYSWSVVSIFWFLHPHIFILKWTCQQFSFQARNVKGSLSSFFNLYKCYIQIVKMLIWSPCWTESSLSTDGWDVWPPMGRWEVRTPGTGISDFVSFYPGRGLEIRSRPSNRFCDGRVFMALRWVKITLPW